MCLASTSARPSRTPLSVSAVSTGRVMLRKARRATASRTKVPYDTTSQAYLLPAQPRVQIQRLAPQFRCRQRGRGADLRVITRRRLFYSKQKLKAENGSCHPYAELRMINRA